MNPTILLIDDEVSLVSALSRALSRAGYAVRTATCAGDAIRILESTPIDVVVSDEEMPGKRGSELLEEIAARWPATVRMMLTGQADLDVAMRAINRGHVLQFFVKPTPASVVATAISRCLELSRLADASLQLLKTTRAQARVIAKLERADPGITELKRDTSGAIVLEEPDPRDIAQLIAALERESGNRR